MSEEEVVILEADPLSSTEEGFAPIEEENAAEIAAADSAAQEEVEEQKNKSKKKWLILLILGAVLLLSIIITLVVIIKNKQKVPEPVVVEKAVEKPVMKEQFSPSKLDGMIKKHIYSMNKATKTMPLKSMKKLPPLMKPFHTTTLALQNSKNKIFLKH